MWREDKRSGRFGALILKPLQILAQPLTLLEGRAAQGAAMCLLFLMDCGLAAGQEAQNPRVTWLELAKMLRLETFYCSQTQGELPVLSSGSLPLPSSSSSAPDIKNHTKWHSSPTPFHLYTRAEYENWSLIVGYKLD